MAARRLLGLIAGSAALLGLAACTADDGPSGSDGAATASASDEPTAAAPIDVAWTADLEVFSGPADADGTVLVYTTEQDRFYLVGLDAGSGEELWRQEASTGSVVTGIALTPSVVDGHPVYFRPDDTGNLFAELVVADPATGEDLVVTDPYLFSSTPGACDDDESAACIDARASSDESRASYRVATDGNGALKAVDGLEGRGIGSDGLRELRDDDVEYLTRFDDAGTELWRHDVADAFGDGYSSDYGWAWDYDEDADVFYGYVGYQTPLVDGARVVDADGMLTVGLDGTTGEVLWTEPATRSGCFGALDGAALSDDDEPATAVRCRVTGTKTYVEGEDPTSDGITATVEGFDPATGETLWEQPAHESDGLLGYFAPTNTDDPVRWAGEVSIVIGGDPEILDLATGETTAYDGRTLWCRDALSQEIEYREPYYFDGEPNYTRVGDELESWCDVDGEPVDAEAADPPTFVPDGFGIDVDDLQLVATPDGLVAYS